MWDLYGNSDISAQRSPDSACSMNGIVYTGERNTLAQWREDRW